MNVKQEVILMFRIDDEKRRAIETICFQMGMTAVEVAAEEENAPLGLLAGAEGWRNPLLMDGKYQRSTAFDRRDAGDSGTFRRVAGGVSGEAAPIWRDCIVESRADAAERGVERRAAAGRTEAGTGGIL